MKIVLDSNIFVSSFYWKGNPRKVFERVTNGLDELYITDEILNEIFTVMSRKKFDSNPMEIEERGVCRLKSDWIFPAPSVKFSIRRPHDRCKSLL
jgi:predicted nucleic acid-binding protein